ncbi:MAG TPA: YggT family protein [Actinomycetota bacterium]|nr:YggT family protein [Actinomycetota bacterium]
MNTVASIICILLSIYWVILFARIILSWFPPPMSGIGRTLWDIVHDLTEPVLGLVRGLLPPVRMGTMGLDLSPIIVFIALFAVREALC